MDLVLFFLGLFVLYGPVFLYTRLATFVKNEA